MKTKRVLIISIIAFASALCQKNNGIDNSAKLTLIKTELGGCNVKKSDHSNENRSIGDTVIISLKKDSIDIFVGLNYICCAPFKTDCKIKNDSVIISIRDTCSNPRSCYCRCSCYYTFNFKFTLSVQDNYCYKILLFDPRLLNIKLIQEGVIKSKIIN